MLAIDQSEKAIAQARAASWAELETGVLSFRLAAAEDFQLEPDEPRYDTAVAVRVRAFDGRHPDAGARARRRISAALEPGGRLFIDGGDPLRVVPLTD